MWEIGTVGYNCEVLPNTTFAGPSRGGKGGAFPGPATSSLKSTEKGAQDGLFLTSNMHKIHFRPCFPGPAVALDGPAHLVMIRDAPFV